MMPLYVCSLFAFLILDHAASERLYIVDEGIDSGSCNSLINGCASCDYTISQTSNDTSNTIIIGSNTTATINSPIDNSFGNYTITGQDDLTSTLSIKTNNNAFETLFLSISYINLQMDRDSASLAGVSMENGSSITLTPGGSGQIWQFSHYRILNLVQMT